MKLLNKSTILLAVVLVGVLVVYRYTAQPGVGWVDSGGLAAAAQTLGIANPPGFPSYMVLGHIFIKLFPFGSSFDKLQLMSQLGALGILALVWWWVRRLVEPKWREWSALWTVVVFAFSYNLWSQASNIETYTLTNFSLLLILTGSWWIAGKLGIQRYLEQKSKKLKKKAWNSIWLKKKGKYFIPTLAFIGGLSAGFNPVVSAVVPAGLWWLWSLRDLVMKHWKVFFLAAVLAVAGVVLTYSYLPIRASTKPYLNWGDPVTPEKIRVHLFGEGLNIYEPETNSINGFTAQPIVMWESFWHYWHMALIQFTPVLFPLIFVGAVELWRKNRFTFWILSLPVLTNLTYVVLYYGGNQESWMISSWVIFAIFMGVGVDKIWRWLDIKKPDFAILARFFVLFLALLPLLFWFKPLNRKHHSFPDDYATNLYKGLPEGAVVVGGGDYFNSLSHYVHSVSHFREDVIPITGNMFYIFDWYRDGLSLNTGLNVSQEVEDIIQYKSVHEFTNAVDQLIIDNPDRQFYVTPILLRDTVVAGTTEGNYHTDKFKLLPHGLLYKVVPLDSEEKVDESLYEFTFTYPEVMFGESPFFLERNYKGAYNLLRNNYAVAYASLGDYFYEMEDLTTAENYFMKAAEQATDSSPEFINRLAVFYAQTNQLLQAKNYFMQALQLRPDDESLLYNLQILNQELQAQATISGTLSNRPDAPSIPSLLDQESMQPTPPSISIPEPGDSVPPVSDSQPNLQPGRVLHQTDNFSFSHPENWLVLGEEGSIVLDPVTEFRIDITSKPLESEPDAKTAAQESGSEGYGILVNEGGAKIPNMDDGWLRIWEEPGNDPAIKVFEFYLIQNETIFKVIVRPAGGPQMEEFDQVVSSLKAN